MFWRLPSVVIAWRPTMNQLLVLSQCVGQAQSPSKTGLVFSPAARVRDAKTLTVIHFFLFKG